MTAAYEDLLSLKSFWQEVGEELACQHEKGNPNSIYAVRVTTDATKTVQIKYNTDLYSFQLHSIITLVLTELKLTHGLVKFPVH